MGIPWQARATPQRNTEGQTQGEADRAQSQPGEVQTEIHEEKLNGALPSVLSVKGRKS